MTIYYLPIDCENLSHYFSSALISPADNYTNRIKDIQSGFKTFQIISEYKWIKDCNCSLELVFDDENDKALLVESGQAGVKFLTNPLPISRIKTIWLTNNNDKESIVYKINQRTAFAPEFLFNIEVPNNVKEIDFNLLNTDNINTSNSSDSSKVDSYNNLLGGISLMRSVCNAVDNISEFLSFTSQINLLIDNEFKRLTESKILRFNYYYSGVLSPGDKWKIIRERIQKKDASIEKLKELSKQRSIDLEISGIKSKIGKLDLLAEKDEELYLLSFTAQYGDDTKSYATDSLLKEVFEKKFKGVEKIALVFGLYNGYKNFSNKYHFEDKDYNVKFELNSKMDYYLIESAYQRTFNKKEVSKITEFSYLDEWLPYFEKKTQNSDCDYYTILDTVVYSKKKQSFLSPEYSEDLYKEYSAIIDREIESFIQKIGILDIIINTNGIRMLLKELILNILKKIKTYFKPEHKSVNLVESDYKKEIANLHKQINDLKRTQEDFKATQEKRITKVNIVDESIQEKPKEDYNKIIVTDILSDVSAESSKDILDDYNRMPISELRILAKKHLKIQIKSFDSFSPDDIINKLKEYDKNNRNILN